MEITKPKNRRPFASVGWKFYDIGGGRFFFQTYNKSGRPRAIHSALEPRLLKKEPVAQTSYSGSKKGFITTYLVESTQIELHEIAKKIDKEIELINLSKAFYEKKIDLGYNFFSEDIGFGKLTEKDIDGKKIDHDYNISSEHIDLGKLIRLLKKTIRHDIHEFCNGKPGKDKINLGNHYTLVDKIIPSQEISFIEPKSYGAVVKWGKGNFHDICLIDIGLDFSQGCVSNLTTNMFYAPFKQCDYCYAHKNRISFGETVYDFDEKFIKEGIEEKLQDPDLKDKKVIYIRLGQTTESCPPLIVKEKMKQDPLKIALRAIIKMKKYRDIRIAMPSKTSEYDKELSRLFKEADVSVLTSVAYEPLETGILDYGFDVDKRLDELLKYAKKGVNSNIYIATDLTRSMDYMQPDAKKAFQFYKDHSDILHLQFLGMRITRKRNAVLIGGNEWGSLKYSDQLGLLPEPGRWGLTGQTYLYPVDTHKDFLKIIKNNKGNIRLCSTYARKDQQRCGSCFMDIKNKL